MRLVIVHLVPTQGVHPRNVSRGVRDRSALEEASDSGYVMCTRKQYRNKICDEMWEHVRHLTHNHNNDVTVQHIRLWKRETGFKHRFKKNNLSLCELFNK